MTAVERPRIRVRVDNGRLTAVSAYDQELIDKLPLGLIVAEMDTEDATDGVRNLYMAGIGTLFDNTDGCGPGKTWPTATSLRKFILKEIGLAEAVIRVDGVKWVPVSMARGEMNYADLVTCLELSRAFCLDRFGFDPFEQWQEAKDLENQKR